MDGEVDYVHIYKTLKMSVKKSFFKRPTIHGGSSSDFACVSKSLTSQECPELAAVFLLGKAECESHSKDTVAEASTLFTAGKCFLQAEDRLDGLNAITHGDNLDSATACLLKAAKLYESSELFTLAANVYIFLCDNLIRRRKWTEAVPHLKRSLEILTRDVLCSLQVLSKLVTCQLGVGDWMGALNTCLRIQALVAETEASTTTPCTLELHSQYWVIAEVLRVCLVLITSPPNKLSAPTSGHGYSLDNYSLDSRGAGSGIDETLFLHLQSLILAYHSGDVVELEASSGALRVYFDVDQCTIISLLLDELTNPFANIV